MCVLDTKTVDCGYCRLPDFWEEEVAYLANRSRARHALDVMRGSGLKPQKSDDEDEGGVAAGGDAGVSYSSTVLGEAEVLGGPTGHNFDSPFHVFDLRRPDGSLRLVGYNNNGDSYRILDGPVQSKLRVPLCAARTLNAVGQSRVTLSLS